MWKQWLVGAKCRHHEAGWLKSDEPSNCYSPTTFAVYGISRTCGHWTLAGEVLCFFWKVKKLSDRDSHSFCVQRLLFTFQQDSLPVHRASKTCSAVVWNCSFLVVPFKFPYLTNYAVYFCETARYCIKIEISSCIWNLVLIGQIRSWYSSMLSGAGKGHFFSG